MFFFQKTCYSRDFHYYLSIIFLSNFINILCIILNNLSFTKLPVASELWSFHAQLWVKILLLMGWPNILHPQFPPQFHGLNIPLSDPYNAYRVYQTRRTLDQELVNFWKISKPQISHKSFLPSCLYTPPSWDLREYWSHFRPR